jgi:hypothetical protein
MSKKRAFVRYSKQGKIVPGSLILTAGSYPNGPSTWKEVSADLCCLIPQDYTSCLALQGIPENSEGTFVYGFSLDTYNIPGKYLSGTIYWAPGEEEHFNLPTTGDTYDFVHEFDSSAPQTVYLCVNNPSVIEDFELGFGPGDTVSLNNARALSGVQEWDSDDMNIYSLDLSNMKGLSQLYHCCSILTHINITGSVGLIDVDLSSNALTQASVDHVLITLDNNGLENGFLALDSGTSSIPSAAGLAAKTSLEGKGWSVNVNS